MLTTKKSVLCLDIGSITQDVYYYLPDLSLQNSVRLVLPSPELQIKQEIIRLNNAQKNIYLSGKLMGGGFYPELLSSIKNGLTVATQKAAALSLHDNLTKVQAAGIKITDSCPDSYVNLELSDFSVGFWQKLFILLKLPYPDIIIAAAQDHGVHENKGNRQGRMELWHSLLQEKKGNLLDLIYPKANIPSAFTRLQSLAECIGETAYVADTGVAAGLGLLSVPELQQRCLRQGLTFVNIGNTHVTAFLVFENKVFGVYEQHTDNLNLETLGNDLKEFKTGWLPNEKVEQEGGHGCIFMNQLPAEAEGFKATFLVGPQRNKFKTLGQNVDVQGDMMLTGCFGLLYGLGGLAEDKFNSKVQTYEVEKESEM